MDTFGKQGCDTLEDMEPALRRMTLEEYEAFEERSERPHEYRDGFAIGRTLPSPDHATISGSLVIAFGAAIRARGCRFFAENGKVVVPGGDRLIPDFVATCDARDFERLRNPGEPLLCAPWLAVEILSPSTAADDAVGKGRSYRSIPELTHYVMIDSRRRWVMVQERSSDGAFTMREPLEAIVLPNLPPSTLEEIYRGTSVPA